MAFTLQRYGLIGARRRSRKGSNTNLLEAKYVWSGLMEARREYTFGKLNSEDLNLSPVDQFARGSSMPVKKESQMPLRCP